MLSNAYFVAKFRFDTAETEPAKNLQNFARKKANFNDPNPWSREAAVVHSSPAARVAGAAPDDPLDSRRPRPPRGGVSASVCSSSDFERILPDFLKLVCELISNFLPRVTKNTRQHRRILGGVRRC